MDETVLDDVDGGASVPSFGSKREWHLSGKPFWSINPTLG
jgi:hypothetical protein